MKLAQRSRAERQKSQAPLSQPGKVETRRDQTTPTAMTTAERVRALETLAPTYEYTCPMHAEVRQAQEGSCPKCGMLLSTVKPSVLGAYRLEVASLPRAPKAGEKVRLNFIVSHRRRARAEDTWSITRRCFTCSSSART